MLPDIDGYEVLRRLRRADLPADTVVLARFLVGTILVRDEPEAGRLAARIAGLRPFPVPRAVPEYSP